MASHYFGSDIDLGNKELLRSRLENQTTDPVGYPGKVYFNTANSIPRYYDGTQWVDFAIGGTGVTSVALSAPASLFSVSGSPVTSSGTLGFSLVNQSSGLVFAGPASGPSATPTFRSLTVTDLGSGSPIAGSYLDGGTQSWTPLPTSGVQELNDLDDVTITSLTINQFLQYDGSQWVNVDPNFVTSDFEIELTGDVTGTGELADPIVTTITNKAVTFAKIRDISSGSILGRTTSGSGSVEEITISDIFSGRNFRELVGDGAETEFLVTHNLSDNHPIVTIKEVSTGFFITTEVRVNNSNSIEVTFSQAPTASQYEVSVNKTN